MWELVQSYFHKMIQHYKEMTTVVFIFAILKFYPVFFLFLNIWLKSSHRKKRIKLWVDAGLNVEQAEKMVDSDFKKEKSSPWLMRFLKRYMRKKK